MFGRYFCQIAIEIYIHVFMYTFSLFINNFRTQMYSIPYH